MTERELEQQAGNGQEPGAAFHWHLLDKGIGHVCTTTTTIAPTAPWGARPQMNACARKPRTAVIGLLSGSRPGRAMVPLEPGIGG